MHHYTNRELCTFKAWQREFYACSTKHQLVVKRDWIGQKQSLWHSTKSRHDCKRLKLTHSTCHGSCPTVTVNKVLWSHHNRIDRLSLWQKTLCRQGDQTPSFLTPSWIPIPLFQSLHTQPRFNCTQTAQLSHFKRNHRKTGAAANHTQGWFTFLSACTLLSLYKNTHVRKEICRSKGMLSCCVSALNKSLYQQQQHKRRSSYRIKNSSSQYKHSMYRQQQPSS